MLTHKFNWNSNGFSWVNPARYSTNVDVQPLHKFVCCLAFCRTASLPKPQATSGQLCLKSSLQPHMEPSFEQEPAEEQHQTTCAPVSENGPVPGLHICASTQLELVANHQQVFIPILKSDHIFNEQGMQCSIKLYLSGLGCWNREWTGLWPK